MDQVNETPTTTTATASTTHSAKRGGGGKTNNNNNSTVAVVLPPTPLAAPVSATLPQPQVYPDHPPLIVPVDHQPQPQPHYNETTAVVVAAETLSSQPLPLPVVHTEMLPPELRDVFEISSFIAHARPMMKPCFRTRTYVTKDSWIGAIFRRFHGESAMLGALQIQRISERLSSSLQQYRGKIWEPTIRNHLVDFLKGVKIIQETYYDYTEVTPILCTTILTGEHALNSVRPLSQPGSSGGANVSSGGMMHPGTSVSSQTN
jgi:hypothetical protein